MISTPNLDLQYYLDQIGAYFTSHGPSFFGTAKSFIGLVTGLSIVLSVLLIIGLVITVEAVKSQRKKEEEMYNAKVEPAYTAGEAGDAELAHRWSQVMEHMASGNQNDWKQAIIEADVLLDNMVTKQGYQGDSLGEKLKRVSKGDFKTLDQAWEAHLVRNRIAHDGSGFEINQVEAQRVIGLYRQVFKEFYHIS